MQTNALTASQFSITVGEQGYAVAVSELLLNASFDDVMASGARLLGRNMALYLDGSARDTLYQASSKIFGYNKFALAGTPISPAEPVRPRLPGHRTGPACRLGTTPSPPRSSRTPWRPWRPRTSPGWATPTCASCTRTSRRQLRDDPEFIEVTKYAAPGNFMIGEIGRLNDVVFIETTQVTSAYVSGSSGALYYDAVFIGDNAFGHAISLPVELRDGGILDFGREHALAWYSIWGLGLITDQSVLVAETN